MIVEWLADNLQKARIIYRGRAAIVHVYRFHNYGCSDRAEWQFDSTGRDLNFWPMFRLNSARVKELARREVARTTGREWVPVAKLPKVRMIARK